MILNGIELLWVLQNVNGISDGWRRSSTINLQERSWTDFMRFCSILSHHQRCHQNVLCIYLLVSDKWQLHGFSYFFVFVYYVYVRKWQDLVLSLWDSSRVWSVIVFCGSFSPSYRTIVTVFHKKNAIQSAKWSVWTRMPS